MKERSSTRWIPIFSGRLEIVATDDIIASQKVKRRAKRMGIDKPIGCVGLFLRNGWDFCIIYHTKYLDDSLIAHEALHATHRILDYNGVEFDLENHETFAFMQGWVSEQVYKDLKKWKIKIK